MMPSAEARALLVREQLLAAGAWKIPDPDEAELETCCEVCVAPIRPTPVKMPWGGITYRKPKPGTRVCTPCVYKGWRSTPCVVCGGITRTWDWSSKVRNNAHRGYCQTCREKDNAEKELAG